MVASYLRSMARKAVTRCGLQPSSDGARLSFAQEGEDLVLLRAMEPSIPEIGFYVDVGAHHPFRFSNTNLFYRRGWRGINIDAMPGSMRLFEQYRPRDINLEIAVAEVPGEREYFMFNEPALNGFCRKLAESRDGLRQYKIIGSGIIPVRPLRDILASHLPEEVAIDFLSIDVEGLDLEVLRSNDWERFRPQFILVEMPGQDDAYDLCDTQTAEYLVNRGYRPRFRTVSTACFEKA